MKLICFIGLVCLIIGQTLSYSQSRTDSPRRYCSKNLANQLRLLCAGRYNGGFSKKSIPMIDIDDGDDYQYDQSEEEQRWPFLPRKMANSLMDGSRPRTKRQFGGIVDECCKKPCTLNEMIGYCQN